MIPARNRGAGRLLSITGLGVLTLLAAPAGAQAPLGPRDPREVEAFFDGLIPALLAVHHAPGAVVSVVRDGQVLFEKGYGYADLGTGRPMDPERTVVRVASVSKLVTATAAMQLVAAGRLDLHADINRYLDRFRIEDGFGGPVTLHHLLTHTAGFDDRFLHSSRTLGSELPPLGDYLARRMPPRVMPPGRVVSYSNHGLALVGHLVERGSGLSFADYVQRNVFDPLKMAHSRFFLRFPLDPDLAVPYRWKGGRHVPMGYDHTLLGPAAELNTTAGDMANFMSAHLQAGRFGDAQILPPETERLMQERHFSVHPEVSGWCYGFEERVTNGHRGVGHVGDWRGFRSLLLLYPQHGFGLFASVNGELSDLAFWEPFGRAFHDHYLPDPRPSPAAAPADFSGRAGRYAGTYLPSRRMRSDLLRLADLVSHVEVGADAEGLTLRGAGGYAVRLLPIGPDLFRVYHSGTRAYYFTEPDTGTEHLVVGPFTTLDKVKGWRNPRLHVMFGVATIVLFVATLLGFGLGGAARRLAGAAPSPTTPAARGVAAAACALLLLGLFGVQQQLDVERSFDVLIEVPPVLRAALVALHLAVPFTVALPYFALWGFRPDAKAPLARLHYAALALAGLGFLAQAAYWNLLGPGAFR
jgi:CubicO group peptidase (beta-lactamase class C family)